MSRTNPLMLDDPPLTFAAHFWRNLLDDYHGRGCPDPDSLPMAIRRSHTHQERVIIERERLSVKAAAYLDTDDFSSWAYICGMEPSALREAIKHDSFQ